MNGQYIRSLRENAGLSQKQMAEKLGYFSGGVPNRSHIARIEGGHQKISERLSLAVQHVCLMTKQGKAITYGPEEPQARWTPYDL